MWNDLQGFFNIARYLFMGVTIGLAGVTIYLAWSGVLPVLYKLGKGISNREIAIFASGEYGSLKTVLMESKIFKEKNIKQVHKNHLSSSENNDIFLVHWSEYKENIDEILRFKKNRTALIVYAPQNEGRIPDDVMAKITSQPNSLVVNFRGRLLNDILISLMTTGYQ